jgi:lysophospholipase L1-like esterase
MFIQKIQKISITFFSLFLLSFMATGTAFAATNTKTVDYVALGDSLAAGQNPYGTEHGYSYPNSIKNMLASSGNPGSYQNFGVSGYTTTNILDQLNNPKIQKFLTNAEIVTLDVGANDILVLPAVQAYLAAPSDENLAAATDAVIAEFYYIGNNIGTIIGTIKGINPTAKIYVMGYYDAFPSNPELIGLIQGLNGAILSAAAATGVAYVNTWGTVTPADLPNALDIHPTHEGYKAISAEFCSAIADDFWAAIARGL